jgi:hypothetical protein
MSVRNLVTLIYTFAGEIRNGRTPEDVLRHADSEMDELREEVEKFQHDLDEGADGIVGEAVDIIACIVDLLHEIGTPLEEAITEIEAATNSRPPSQLNSLPGFVKAIEDRLQAVRQAVTVRYMAVPRSAFLVRTLLALIDRHDPDVTMAGVEAIALKKCEKWKLYYSKSVERVR